MKILKKFIKQIKAVNKRLIFISYPTKSSLEDAYKICRYWWHKGYIAICPRIMFSYMSNDGDRAIIMTICKLLLCLCGTFALYGDSKGCKEEHTLARKLNKQIFILYGDEKIDFKRMMESNKEVML